MSETLTGTATDVPDYPMERDARCPFAPPPQVLEMGAAKPLSRVRIWDGSTPWLITGHEIGLHVRRRGAHPVPSDAVQAVHLQARRGAAARHPASHRRMH